MKFVSFDIQKWYYLLDLYPPCSPVESPTRPGTHPVILCYHPPDLDPIYGPLLLPRPVPHHVALFYQPFTCTPSFGPLLLPTRPVTDSEMSLKWSEIVSVALKSQKFCPKCPKNEVPDCGPGFCSVPAFIKSTAAAMTKRSTIITLTLTIILKRSNNIVSFSNQSLYSLYSELWWMNP